MNQEQFDQATQGTFALFREFQGTGPHYKLISITAEWKVGNPQILVSVLGENGLPQAGITIHNRYPGDSEDFPSRYPYTEFNLGPGSKTEHGKPGPHRIVIDDGDCDIVDGLGIPNLGRDGYVRFTLIYKLTNSIQQPPGPDTSGKYVTRTEAIVALSEMITTLQVIKDGLEQAA